MMSIIRGIGSMNPLRAATPEGIARIQHQHDAAFDSRDPAKVRTFRIKIMNVWVYDSDNSYIGDYLGEWDKLGVSREEFVKLTTGMSCSVGLDLSKKIDLTADAHLFILGDDRIAVCAHGFIPEEAIRKHEQTDRIPYRDWAKEGLVDCD